MPAEAGWLSEDMERDPAEGDMGGRTSSPSSTLPSREEPVLENCCESVLVAVCGLLICDFLRNLGKRSRPVLRPWMGTISMALSASE